MKNIVSGVYTIYCTISNKYYVGESGDVYERLQYHKQDLRNNRHHNRHLQAAWNKYGEENFEFDLLEQCSKDIKYALEHFWCNALRSNEDDYGYNIGKTNIENGKGELSPETIKLRTITRQKRAKERGYYHTQETKNKIRKAHKGLKMSEEHKLKLQKIHKGSKRSKESIIKAVENRKNYKHSEETKNKMSKAHIGIPKSKEAKEKGAISRLKPIIQYDLEGNYIKEWTSVKEVVETIGFTQSNISQVCLGYRKTAHGYKWKFKNEEDALQKFRKFIR